MAMIQEYRVLSLLTRQLPIIFDFTQTEVSITLAVHVVRDKLRAEQISTAVFKLNHSAQWYAHHVEVYPDYRRCGLATVMYQFVQSEIAGCLVPSDDQSPDAKAFWNFFRTVRHSGLD